MNHGAQKHYTVLRFRTTLNVNTFILYDVQEQKTKQNKKKTHKVNF